MQSLTVETLQSTVLSPRERPAVVLFWMAGCSLCALAKPAFESLDLDKVCDRFLFEMKPEEPETLREAAKLGMRDWPIFAIYTKKGQPTAAVSKLVEPVLLDDFIRRTIAETTTKKKFSLWQMAKSFADTVIGSFIDLMFARNPIASKPVQAVRASICEPCYDRKDKSCGVCGCLLKAKQMVRASSCPKGLW